MSFDLRENIELRSKQAWLIIEKMRGFGFQVFSPLVAAKNMTELALVSFVQRPC